MDKSIYLNNNILKHNIQSLNTKTYKSHYQTVNITNTRLTTNLTNNKSEISCFITNYKSKYQKL
jgi:hypothetical protein